MKKLLWTLACLFVAMDAFAQPDHRAVVEQLFATGHYDLRTHEGQGAFVDAVVADLHLRDNRWGHLKKNPGQTQLHGHAEDAALYLSDIPGQSVAVDFIGGAGGDNPRPGWNVDSPRYSRVDWFPPHEHPGVPPLPPAPVDYALVLDKLDALAQQIAVLALRVEAASDRAESARIFAQEARNRIEDTLTAVDLARQQLNRPPLYVGRVFGFNVTLRPSIHPANAIPPQ